MEGAAQNRHSDRYKKSSNGSDKANNILTKTIRDFLSEINCKEEEINAVKTDKDVLDLIIKLCKAKRFVGAGVGGLLINHDSNEVLLYLRPKEPEIYKWSQPGGSVNFGENATVSLIQEFKYITGIHLQARDFLPLRITNHKDDNKPCNYHYLSPAFTVKNPNDFLEEINQKISSEKRLTNDSQISDLANNLMQGADEEQINHLKEDIKSGKYFLKEWEKEMKEKIINQPFKKYIVKWFSISEIKDSDRLSEPTKKALKSYLQRINTINNIAQETNDILQRATKETQERITNINIETIIETDE